jgi:hypothetical protein
MTMREPVRAVLESLLSRRQRAITLDELGDAIGAMSITGEEIGALIDALEGEGCSVAAEPGGDGAKALRQVLDVARTMKASGRTPTAADIASATGLPLPRVHHALALARIMSR